MKLFITAFIQVFLVSMNAYFISRLYWIGIAFAGFGISFFWSINVKKIAFSGVRERLIYCFGATIGGLIGVYLGSLII